MTRENEKRRERDTPPLNPHIIVMPRGDRDLAVAMLKERLSLPAVADIITGTSSRSFSRPSCSSLAQWAPRFSPQC